MRVLVFSAHPDDMEECCAGTLLKCRDRGDEVFVCHLSNGDLGHEIIMPDELGLMRRQEAKNAGSLGGFTIIWGGFTDLCIFDNKEAVDKVVNVIRDVDPDFIITHNPDDYMPDHINASKLVFSACFAATVPHYKGENNKPARLVPLFYMDTSCGMAFEPTEYVDISPYIDKKLEMINCHKSQIVWLRDHDGIDYPDEVKACSRYRGFQCGAEYAEGFRQCTVYLKGTTKRYLP